MQDLLVFLFLGVGRLREDQLIYVETRENVFFYDMGPLMLKIPQGFAFGNLFNFNFCNLYFVNILPESHYEWMDGSIDI